METIKEIVCRNCKRLLDKKKNLSEIARLMQINPTTISRWKSGKHAPELEKIDKLAEVLGVSRDEFFSPIVLERPVELPISKTLQRMMKIPDEVYSYAEKFGVEHEVWDTVLKALELQELKDERKKQANRA